MDVVAAQLPRSQFKFEQNHLNLLLMFSFIIFLEKSQEMSSQGRKNQSLGIIKNNFRKMELVFIRKIITVVEDLSI